VIRNGLGLNALIGMWALMGCSGRTHERKLDANYLMQGISECKRLTQGDASRNDRIVSSILGGTLALLMCGCAQIHYQKTQPGMISGDLIIEWRKPDEFLYKPSASNPLRFIRSNGDVIQPELMWTDGGSVPRPMWIFRNYSPWGYGPAFIIHDWLFTMQDCELPGHTAYSFDDSAEIMSEVIRTLLDLPDFDYGSIRSMYLMHKAVQSASAYASWTDKECIEPPSAFEAFISKPDAVYTISFN